MSARDLQIRQPIVGLHHRPIHQSPICVRVAELREHIQDHLNPTSQRQDFNDVGSSNRLATDGSHPAITMNGKRIKFCSGGKDRSTTEAMSAVFNTSELLELILLNVAVEDPIVKAPLVCQAFRILREPDLGNVAEPIYSL